MNIYQIYRSRAETINLKLVQAALDKNGELYDSLIREFAFLSSILSIIDEIEKKYLDISSFFSFIRQTSVDSEIVQYKNEILILRQEIDLLRLKFKETVSRKVETIQQQEISNDSTQNQPSSSRRKKKDFAESIKKVKSKEWDAIKKYLIQDIPVVSQPGIPPEEKIDDLIELVPFFREIKSKEINAEEGSGLNVVFETEIPQIARQIALKHGVYLLHKSSHVVSAAEIQCDLGLPSWSMSSAYQGAYLGAKSILYLLGLVVIPFENETYLLDLWRHANSEHEGKIKIGAIRFEYKIEHRHSWELFARVINSYKIPIWRKQIVDALSQFDEKDFSKQRNHLNYWTGNWIFDDMHKFLIKPELGVYPNGMENGLQEFKMQSDFSLVLAQVVLNFAVNLLDDLSSETNALNLEKKLLKSFLNNYDRHPIYVKNTF